MYNRKQFKQEKAMPTKSKRTKKTHIIPEHRKHQPKLVCSLAWMLAIMTFIAGTAIGAFFVAQAMRIEERQNRDAILFIYQEPGVDASTLVIYRNGLIAEIFSDDRPSNKAVLSDMDLQDLQRRIDGITRDDTRRVREVTSFEHGYSLNRVFSHEMNRWVVIREYRGSDIVRSNSRAVEDLVGPIERLIEIYLLENMLESEF